MQGRALELTHPDARRVCFRYEASIISQALTSASPPLILLSRGCTTTETRISGKSADLSDPFASRSGPGHRERFARACRRTRSIWPGDRPNKSAPGRDRGRSSRPGFTMQRPRRLRSPFSTGRATDLLATRICYGGRVTLRGGITAPIACTITTIRSTILFSIPHSRQHSPLSGQDRVRSRTAASIAFQLHDAAHAAVYSAPCVQACVPERSRHRRRWLIASFRQFVDALDRAGELKRVCELRSRPTCSSRMGQSRDEIARWREGVAFREAD